MLKNFKYTQLLIGKLGMEKKCKEMTINCQDDLTTSLELPGHFRDFPKEGQHTAWTESALEWW